VHGWDIKKATGRSGPTVYGVIDRLQDAGWIEGEWEQQASDDSRPRRRLYKLQGSAVPVARALMAERRPAAVPLRRTRLRAAVPGLGGLR
jgi:PadR family transcriptional regulator, regulatory protein PadR